MSARLSAALAAGNVAEAATLAFAQAGLGALPIAELIGVAGLLAGRGQPQRAVALYQLWLRYSDAPLRHAAWHNLAVLQAQGGDARGAEAAYQRALELQPHFIEAHLGLGALMEQRRRPERALDIWRAALALLEPGADHAGALRIRLFNGIARVAGALGRRQQALAALERSLRLDPRQPLAAAQRLRLRQQQCAWPPLAPLPGLDEERLLAAADAPAMLNACDEPALQLAAARRHVAQHVAPAAALADAAGYVHRKLRVGYLGPDAQLHNAGLYALHDRAWIEVYGFCWAPEDDAPERRRLVRGLDHHLRIAGDTDLEAAQLIRAQQIDILVDLHGLGAGGRPGILGHRPAPVQIAWPGYPGTTALAGVDHVLADAYALPPTLAPYFTEQPLYLPDSAQVLERRPAPARRRSRAALRAECALPAVGVVFCCFSDSDKLAPPQFASWMRILLRVPGSVLWLAVDDEQARDHLRVAALGHGIAAERLHFAGPAHAEARYRAADLFLDTLPCNAGTPAREALQAGLPLLTCSGRSYASRSSGSLLHAAGLAQLVTHSSSAYEDAAVRLARAPRQLAALRASLTRQSKQGTTALFDLPRWVRHLEQAYLGVARGTLLRGAQGGMGMAVADHAGSGLPLVAILIAAQGDDAPAADALERTLRSALAQSWAATEIIVCDSSAGDTLRARAAPLLALHPQLRYHRAPGLAPAAALDHCLALSRGAYIAVAPQGGLLQPDKLARAMHCYLQYPNVGLVGGWRRAPDAAAPLFGVDTLLDGAALGDLLLSADPATTAALCAPATLLLRRDTLGPGFGHYGERRYPHLPWVAVALSALAGRAGVYLAQPLSSSAAAAPDAADATPRAGVEALARALDGLQLLYAVHARQAFLTDRAAFRDTLAARLAALSALLTGGHGALVAGAGAELAALQDTLHDTLRQGYQLLLSP